MTALPPRCATCLEPATVQVLSPEGVPVPAGTFCDEHWREQREFGQRAEAMLEDAIAKLS